MKTRLAFGLLAILSMCAGAQTTAPATRPSTESKFLRFVDDGHGGGRLQASVVTYRSPTGQTVDLIAAVHVADPSFFRELGKSFEQYDALLYEMVKPREMGIDELPSTRPSRHSESRESRPLSWVSTLQMFMKNTLQLSFQLEEIDYTKPNFVHADLDVETFQKMQADRGESMLTLMLRQMLHEIARGDDRATPAIGLPDLILALQSPDRPRQLKLVLAREFGEIDEMMAGLEGPNGSVLVTERNKAAVRILKDRLARGDRRVGIFYGAAHLRGIEKMITSELGFEQFGEPKWRSAWDMTAR